MRRSRKPLTGSSRFGGSNPPLSAICRAFRASTSGAARRAKRALRYACGKVRPNRPRPRRSPPTLCFLRPSIRDNRCCPKGPRPHLVVGTSLKGAESVQMRQCFRAPIRVKRERLKRTDGSELVIGLSAGSESFHLWPCRVANQGKDDSCHSILTRASSSFRCGECDWQGFWTLQGSGRSSLHEELVGHGAARLHGNAAELEQPLCVSLPTQFKNHLPTKPVLGRDPVVQGRASARL